MLYTFYCTRLYSKLDAENNEHYTENLFFVT